MVRVCKNGNMVTAMVMVMAMAMAMAMVMIQPPHQNQSNCKNGVVFIDEIDNGMHFSSLSSLWKAIISTSKLLNIQVFATTHNIESLQSVNRVLSESAYADSRADIMCYSLRHLPTDVLKSYEYPYEKFQYVINQEIEIR